MKVEIFFVAEFTRILDKPSEKAKRVGAMTKKVITFGIKKGDTISYHSRLHQP